MNEDLFLRMAIESDRDMLFQWANDSMTRANSFSTCQISYEEHCAWFQNVLNDKNKLQFILMHGTEPVGQIRLDVFDNDKANISYSVNPYKRGAGYGKILCKMLIEEVHRNYPYIKKLYAQVKSSNVASIQCFVRSGFSHTFSQYEFKMDDFVS